MRRRANGGDANTPSGNNKAPSWFRVVQALPAVFLVFYLIIKYHVVTTTALDHEHMKQEPCPAEPLPICRMHTQFHHGRYAGESVNETAMRHCPFTRRVQCDRKPKGRALVIYMVTNAEDEYKAQVEWDNFDFFLRSGYIPMDKPTQMFEGVDFVFTRLSMAVNRVTFCGLQDNIKFLWVPRGPCDLCAHARVLKFLEVGPRSNRYSYIFVLNSGVRGPFLQPPPDASATTSSSSWIDVLAMSGRSVASNHLGKPIREGQQEIVGAVSISWEMIPHPQSFMLVLPRSALNVIYPLFHRTCAGIKRTCITNGEVVIGEALLDAGFGLYSFGQNFTFRYRSESDALGAVYAYPPHLMNPTGWWISPCASIFTKSGGDAWRTKLLPESVVRATQRLVITSPLVERQTRRFRPRMVRCEWFDL